MEGRNGRARERERERERESKINLIGGENAWLQTLDIKSWNNHTGQGLMQPSPS